MDYSQVCNGASLYFTQTRLVGSNARDIANLLGDIRIPDLEGLLKLSHSCPECNDALTDKNSSEKAQHFLLGPCKNTDTGKLFLTLLGRSEELAGPLIELCCVLNQLHQCPDCQVECGTFQSLLKVHLTGENCPITIQHHMAKSADIPKNTNKKRKEFVCLVKTCKSFEHDFKRPTNLRRHEARFHPGISAKRIRRGGEGTRI